VRPELAGELERAAAVGRCAHIVAEQREHDVEHLERVLVVVDDQHAARRVPLRAPGGRGRLIHSRRRRSSAGGQRQADREGAALADARALHLDRAAV
jgi:hypothetical protein